LSRVKSNAKIKIVKVSKGVSKTCIGFDLHSGRLSSFRGKIVEVTGQFLISKTKELFQVRIIGFWSTEDSTYHWYATNLIISSDIIYPLYRLRWQLELLWKSWKSFFQLDEINSVNRNIIYSIALAGMCAGIVSETISISVLNDEPVEKQVANSVQRAVSMLLRIAEALFQVITKTIRGSKKNLLDKIYLFKDELFDPNYKSRINSVARVYLNLCPD
jgi:hypothetical protein